MKLLPVSRIKIETDACTTLFLQLTCPFDLKIPDQKDILRNNFPNREELVPDTCGFSPCGHVVSRRSRQNRGGDEGGAGAQISPQPRWPLVARRGPAAIPRRTIRTELKLVVGLQLTSAAPAGMAAHAATDASVQLLTEAAALLKRTLHPRPTLIANVHAELGRAFVTQSLRAAVGPWGGATTLNDATAAAAEAAAAGAARPSTPAEQWGPDGRRVPPPVPPLPVRAEAALRSALVTLDSCERVDRRGCTRTRGVNSSRRAACASRTSRRRPCRRSRRRAARRRAARRSRCSGAASRLGGRRRRARCCAVGTRR